MLHKERMSKQHEHELTVSYRIFPKRAQENFCQKARENFYQKSAREFLPKERERIFTKKHERQLIEISSGNL